MKKKERSHLRMRGKTNRVLRKLMKKLLLRMERERTGKYGIMDCVGQRMENMNVGGSRLPGWTIFSSNAQPFLYRLVPIGNSVDQS